MPVFEVKGSDGTVYELDAPDQRSALQAIQHMNFRRPAAPAPASPPRIYEDAATDAMGNATGFGSFVAPPPAPGPRFRGTPVAEGGPGGVPAPPAGFEPVPTQAGERWWEAAPLAANPNAPAEGPWTKFQAARDGGAVPPPPPGFVLDEP